MGSINPFKKPKIPRITYPKMSTVTAPAVTAPVTDTSAETAAAVEAEKERLKKQKGRAATILTSGGALGDDSTSTAVKKLLGG